MSYKQDSMQFEKNKERFLSKIQFPDDLNGCWLWTGSLYTDGYGVFYADGTKYLAHRYAYLLFNGALTPNLVMDHLCRNHRCVNPHHLEQVTHQENMLRGHSPQALAHLNEVCTRGHAFALHGYLYTTRTGKVVRRCRTCISEYHKLRYRKQVPDAGPGNKDKQFCNHGHPLSGDNIYIYVDPKGSHIRVCRVCERTRWQRKAEKSKYLRRLRYG